MEKTQFEYYLTLFISLTFGLTVFSQEVVNETKTVELDEVKSIDNSKCSEFIDLGEVKNDNENFSTFEPLKTSLKNVEIVMLGEQSHGEGTTYQTKIKLIKFLHQEMGFDLLVFESGIYSSTKAWEHIKKGKDTSISLASSLFYIWSTTKEFRPLAQYIDENKNSKNPLIISGFDNQFTGKIAENEFTTDLKEFILKKDKSIIETVEWKNLETSLKLLFKLELKKYSKKQATKDIAFIETLLTKTKSNDSESKFWNQVLKSTKTYISDSKLKTNLRDKQMAENLIWLKEQYPNKKIICWGATSHFLYNSENIKMKNLPINILTGSYYKNNLMMGDYLKEKYKSKLFTIGFIAYQGEFGLTSRNKIKPAEVNSLEHLIGESGFENCFLDLNTCNSGKLISRPLGNKYMKNNISNVMDGVIFNRNMERPHFDSNLFLKIYPENKWIKPENEE